MEEGGLRPFLEREKKNEDEGDLSANDPKAKCEFAAALFVEATPRPCPSIRANQKSISSKPL